MRASKNVSTMLPFFSTEDHARKGAARRDHLPALFLFFVSICLLAIVLNTSVMTSFDLVHSNLRMGHGDSLPSEVEDDRLHDDPSAHAEPHQELDVGREPASDLTNEEKTSPSHKVQPRNVDSDEVWPKPDGWESYRYMDIRHHFNCHEHSHDQTKPIQSLEDWEYFRSKYNEIVEKAATFDDPVPPTLGYSLVDRGPPPYYPKHTADGRGRGMYATRYIRKGELVHDGRDSDVVFPDGMSWRRYVFSLPRTKACDVADWSWTRKLRDGRYRMHSAMNVSILMNSSREMANVNPRSSTSSKFYALRDIEAQEELLMEYGVYKTAYGKVGL